MKARRVLGSFKTTKKCVMFFYIGWGRKKKESWDSNTPNEDSKDTGC